MNKRVLEEKAFDLVDPGAENVLHIYCGDGSLGKRLKEEKGIKNFFGIEPDSYLVHMASSKIDRVWHGDIQKIRLNNCKNMFDYIILPGTLSELQNPIDFIDIYKNYLKPSGYFVICIPNISHISVIKKLFFGTWTRTQGFTINDISKTMNSAGFKPIKIVELRDPNISEDDSDYIYRLASAVETGESFKEDSFVESFCMKWQKK